MYFKNFLLVLSCFGCFSLQAKYPKISEADVDRELVVAGIVQLEACMPTIRYCIQHRRRLSAVDAHRMREAITDARQIIAYHTQGNLRARRELEGLVQVTASCLTDYAK